MKPKARPGSLAETAVAELAAPAEALVTDSPEAVLVAEAQPELVVTDPGTAVDEVETQSVALMADVTEVETVAGATNAAPPALEIAAAKVSAPLPERKAPIFDAVETVETAAEPEQEVVVVVSTSGGRHFGVNVGEFPSRYEAERALLKTALAESATLNEGNRRTTQTGGAWRASFMGLTEAQAELACRRLSARAIPCETVGG
jgi:D-alanyl-D-alanine carboxypeptidase